FIPEPGRPSQQFTQITDKNSINTMLVSMDIGGLALAANADPNWALVYVETNGLLFVRRSQMPESFLTTHELKTIDLSRNLGFDPEKKNAAIAELLQYTERFPEAVLAKGQLATLYRMENQLDKAEAILMSIPEAKRTFVVKTELGRTMAARGKCKASEYWFLSALKERNERNFARATLDLGILYAACFNDKKKAQHYFARFNSYILHPAEREYLRQVAAQFGIVLDEQ
ncbi:hypothetical protein MUP56_01890, partial [Patescibacteria group bacterium]|nr:hypothetical protein [Patescibacteria group bacterium]